MSGSEFTDFYELLQISPNAEQETIQRVYRMLAARYHPDNQFTGDKEAFVLVNRAYEILSRVETRSDYDVLYNIQHSKPLGVFAAKEFQQGIDGEENRRMGLLCLLYARRRTSPDQAGMSLLEFEAMMAMPREHLLFTVWYLKEKELVRQDETSDFMITAKGVDHVEKNLSANRVLYNLLKAAESGKTRSAGTQGPPETEAAAT